MAETTKRATQSEGAEVANRSDLYESGYDLPSYLRAPLCPKCDRLYCYCPERYAKAEGR